MYWIFGYLLIGFSLHWLGTSVFRIPMTVEWYWELAAVVLWPLTLTLVACKAIANKN